MKNQPEYQLQKQVCEYLRMQYPKVLFLSDTVAAVKLTIPQQVRNKAIQKQGFKCPDLLIFQPTKYFHGLFIELKVKSPFKLNGEILKDEHLIAQNETIQELKKLGYCAKFEWDFNRIKGLIDNYMEDAEPR